MEGPRPCVSPAAALCCPAPRYLLPCSHVMLSQKRAVRDLDIYGKTAAKFLSLIPRCCRPESPPPPRDREEEPPSRARGMQLRPLRAPPHPGLVLSPLPMAPHTPSPLGPGTEPSPSIHPCSTSDSLPTLAWH